MKNILNKSIAGILATAMTLSVMPVVAFAEETDVARINNTTFDSLAEAVAIGGDITLLKNVNISSSGLEITSDVNLDLAGCTITVESSGDKNIYVNSNATLTLEDSESGGKIISSGADSDGGRGAIDVNGTFIMNSGTIDTATNGEKNMNGITLIYGGDATINGGTINAHANAISNHNQMAGQSTIIINGGELISTNSYGIYVTWGATKTYSNVLEINSGSIDSAAECVYLGNSNYNDPTPNVTDFDITGGNFTTDADDLIDFTAYDNGFNYHVNPVEYKGFFDYSITGGTFNVTPNAYVGTGYWGVKNSNDNWEVAKISYADDDSVVDTDALDSLLDASVDGNVSPAAVNAAASAVAGMDSSDIADDADLLGKVNDLDALFVAANDNLDVKTTVSVDESITEENDKIGTVSVSGLGLAVYGDGTTIPESTELTLAVNQTKTETADFAFTAIPQYKDSTTIPNTNLQTPVTFRIDLPTSFTGTYAKVEHQKTGGGTEEFTLPVKTEDGKKYIEITVTGFSNFSVTSYTPSSSKSYYIKATATGNGTVAPEDEDVSPDSMYKVKKMSDVTFEFDADSGYEVADVIVNGKSVGACDEYEFEDIIITMQTLEVVFEKKSSSSSSSSDDDDEDEDEDEEIEEEVVEIELPFTDIDEDNDNFDGIAYVYENGIMAGITSEVFGSELSITRAMIAAILYRIDGSEPVNTDMTFADVAADQYYYEAVKWGKDAGVMAGMSATEFAPNTAITTEQFIAFLYRYANVLDMDMTVDFDTDLSDYTISAYAYTAIAWALENDIIDADDLNPTATAMRGDVATALMNFMEMM